MDFPTPNKLPLDLSTIEVQLLGNLNTHFQNISNKRQNDLIDQALWIAKRETFYCFNI